MTHLYRQGVRYLIIALILRSAYDIWTVSTVQSLRLFVMFLTATCTLFHLPITAIWPIVHPVHII